MIKVLYDYQIFSMQQYGGISRYFANLYAHFKRSETVEAKLGVLYSRNHYIERFASGREAFWGAFRSKHRLHKRNKKYCESLLLENDFDIFHPTYYHPYFLDSCRKPFVITVHDLIHELFPEYFPPDYEYLAFKKEVITRADHIIAISATTQEDLQRIYGIPPEKISLVYHGYTNKYGFSNEVKLDVSDYLLFVGDRKLYKNFMRFLEAAASVIRSNNKLLLICAGGGAFSNEEKKKIESLGIKDSVFQKNVEDDILFELYRKALAFIFPSEYEGFGFPVLEAFDAGCPVALSDNKCFREVAGDAALYFDPHDTENMGQVIRSLIEDKVLAESLRRAGKHQVQLFPMRNCMEGTEAVYQKLAKKNQ